MEIIRSMGSPGAMISEGWLRGSLPIRLSDTCINEAQSMRTRGKCHDDVYRTLAQCGEYPQIPCILCGCPQSVLRGPRKTDETSFLRVSPSLNVIGICDHPDRECHTNQFR